MPIRTHLSTCNYYAYQTVEYFGRVTGIAPDLYDPT